MGGKTSKVELQENLTNAFLKAKNEYDVIAVCYFGILSNGIRDDQVNFVAEYIDWLAMGEEYTDSFQSLNNSIIDIFLKNGGIFSKPGEGMEFPDVCSELVSELEKFKCPDDMNMSVCIAISLYYVIVALDQYVQNELKAMLPRELPESRETSGPLNGGDTLNYCMVYFKERESFLSEAYDRRGKEGFRKPLHQTRIGTMFDAVLLVKKDLLPGSSGNNLPPKIVHLRLDKKRKDAVDNKKLTIASIPYIGFPTFRFYSFENNRAFEEDEAVEGLFGITYEAEAEEENAQRIIKLVNLAVKRGANIITFPEFVMSQKMEEALVNYLHNLNKETRNVLMLVFAGTQYRMEGKDKGNNVLSVYDASGWKIGEYYKYSPFLTQNGEQIHGSLLNERIQSSNRPRKLENCELLSNPGKECVLIDIDGIGRILPAICRDVTDGVYTRRLAELFLPSMIVIPAWSKSVTSFEGQLSMLADTIHTSSLLCNCCNAVGDVNSGNTAGTSQSNTEYKKTTGLFFLPKKRDSAMKAKKLQIEKTSMCVENCVNYGGCIVEIEIDYSKGKPTVIPECHIKGSAYPNYVD